MSERRPITPDDRAEIERMYAAGAKYAEIAEKMGRVNGTIASVVAAAIAEGRLRKRGRFGNPVNHRRGILVRKAIRNAALRGLKPGVMVPGVEPLAKAIGVSLRRASAYRRLALAEAGIVTARHPRGLVVVEAP